MAWYARECGCARHWGDAGLCRCVVGEWQRQEVRHGVAWLFVQALFAIGAWWMVRT